MLWWWSNNTLFFVALIVSALANHRSFVQLAPVSAWHTPRILCVCVYVWCVCGCVCARMHADKLWSTSLISGTKRCSRFVLYILYPGLRIRHFYKESCSFYLSLVQLSMSIYLDITINMMLLSSKID